MSFVLQKALNTEFGERDASWNCTSGQDCTKITVSKNPFILVPAPVCRLISILDSDIHVSLVPRSCKPVQSDKKNGSTKSNNFCKECNLTHVVGDWIKHQGVMEHKTRCGCPLTHTFSKMNEGTLAIFGREALKWGWAFFKTSSGVGWSFGSFRTISGPKSPNYLAR